MITRQQINNSIAKLKEISGNNKGLLSEEIDFLEELVNENKYRVAVIGEFSSGKSTFLNALIGSSVLYSSDSEATGVITYIEGSCEKKAYIHMKNGQKKVINLDMEEEGKDLRTHLDLDQNSQEVEWVGINYPMNGIDQEVCFIDTPGLEGISKVQMETTKKILKEANAVIMLITQKGLSGTELEILSGKYEGFGKINVKDIFVVINKVNNVFKVGRTYEESLIKIQTIKENVAARLDAYGLKNIKLFALDSRDYLWSKDNELFEEILNNTDTDIEEILTQEEYRIRSQFEDFKEFLFKFLEEGERNKNFLDDIHEKLILLIDEFIVFFSEVKRKESTNQKTSLEFLNQQKELLVENKRRLYNSLVRYLTNSFSEFQESAGEAILNQRKTRNKALIRLIDESIETKEDLNKVVIKRCYRELNSWIKEDCYDFKTKAEDFQKHITKYLLVKRVNEDLYKALKQKVELQLNIKEKDIEMDITFKEEEFTEEDILRIIKEEIDEKDREIFILGKEIKKIETKLKTEKDLEIKRQENKKEWERQENILGKIPTPKTKNKTVTKTRRKFIFFKESYEEEVPDGIDYSNVEIWQKESDKIHNVYFKVLEEIDVLQYELNNQKETLKTKNSQLNRASQQKKELEKDLIEAKNLIQEKMEKKEEEYIDSKKNEIYKQLELYSNKQYNLINEKIQDNLYNINLSLKKQLKDNIELYLFNYEKELNNKMKIIKDTLKDEKVLGEELNKIYQVKELLK